MLRMTTMVLAIAGGCLTSASTSVQSQEVTAAEARAIAKEAYIYGYPMVDNYRVQYAYFVDRESPEFKAPWNQISNILIAGAVVGHDAGDGDAEALVVGEGGAQEGDGRSPSSRQAGYL